VWILGWAGVRLGVVRLGEAGFGLARCGFYGVDFQKTKIFLRRKIIMINKYKNTQEVEQLQLIQNDQHNKKKCVNIKILSLRVIKESCARYDVAKKVNSPKKAFEIFTKVMDMEHLAEEHLIMITLDMQNNVTGMFTVSIGSLNSSIVHLREVFKRAIANNAASIILCHNHPSGNPEPSDEDLSISKRICEAGKIIGIELLDHVIIGENQKYISLKERSIF
jgi:DNA repair protein RadC